jgi:hypothetical protein
MKSNPALPALSVLTLFVTAVVLRAAPASSPLRVHPTNSRYFTDGTTNADGSLRGIYLAGHQIFVDLQDRGVYPSVMPFELYGFLDGEPVNGERLWEGNPFHGANNINGMDVDRNRNRLGETDLQFNHPEP